MIRYIKLSNEKNRDAEVTYRSLNPKKSISLGVNSPSDVINKRVLKSLEKADFIIANSKFTKELGLKLGLKDIHVINPGCNYPITVSETAREFSKNIFGNASPKLITVSRLDGRKSHQNIFSH